MTTFTVLPFLGLLVVVYAVIAILGPGTFGDFAGMSEFLNATVFSITNIPSVSETNPLTITTGDLLVAIGLFLLAIEMLKATGTHKKSMVNHLFSVVVFLAAIILFITTPNFGTMTFFLITVMTLVDVLAMFVTIITARRDIGVPGLTA